MLTTDTMAVDTDTDMVMDMDMVSVMAVVTTAMADTPADTDMVDTAVTTVRSNLILGCHSYNLFHNYIHPAANNTFLL